jgi:hypothetical protein
MEEKSKLDKIIEARMKLKARFEDQMAVTPLFQIQSPWAAAPLTATECLSCPWAN